MSAATPPGWYRESPSSPALRWWDGTAWTDARSVPGRVHQPPLPPGTPTATPWIWAIAALPLVSLLIQLPTLIVTVPAYLTAFRQLAQHPSSAVPPGFGQFGLVWTIDWLLSIGLAGFGVVAAYRDRRILADRGVVRPFHWAWSFLGGVYVVGRSVVVQRRLGRGLAPLWFAIGAFVGAWIIQSVVSAIVFGQFFADFSTTLEHASVRDCGCGTS